MWTATLLKITHTMRYTHNPSIPPSARHTHPYSNWQLLLAHLSAVPLCSPATFHQSNYNFIQESVCDVGIVFLGQIANLPSPSKEAENIKRRISERERQKLEDRGDDGWPIQKYNM